MEQGSLSLNMAVSNRDHRISLLNRLRRDHCRVSSCIEVLEKRLRTKRMFKGATSLTEKLIDQLTDAPDEYHHHLERSAFHRLRVRMGRLLPNDLDLDRHHNELRERRGDIMGLRAESIGEYVDNADTRAALLDFCALRRSKIELEETQLFPLFSTGLNCDDWVCLQEEAEAYDAVLSMLTPKHR